jgi:hypothetical protein
VSETTTWEQHAIAEVRRLYGAEGYIVEIAPDVPATLSQLGQIDAVASKGDARVFIQFKRLRRRLARQPEPHKSAALAAAIEKLPNARFDLIALPDPGDGLPTQDDINVRANGARRLVSADVPERVGIEAAMLLASSALEGALRLLAYESQIFVEDDMSLDALAANLWSEGFLSDPQWDRIQDIAAARNALVHGLRAGAGVTVRDVESAAEIAESLSADASLTAQDLIAWFLDRYEEPHHHVPHDSAEGGYRYVMGGPHDAAEILAEQFPNASLSSHDEAVEYLNALSTEWVQRDQY